MPALKQSCGHAADTPNHSCRACWFIHGRPGGTPIKWGIFCVHGTQASRCRCALVFFDLLCSYMKHHRYSVCGGTGRCEHGALTFQCLQCAHGSRICQHRYFKDRCMIDPCPENRRWGKEALNPNPTTEAGCRSLSPASGAPGVASLPGNSWYAVYAMYATRLTSQPAPRQSVKQVGLTQGMLCMLCMLPGSHLNQLHVNLANEEALLMVCCVCYVCYQAHISTSSNSTWQTRRPYSDSFCISNKNKK
jgi:hypothetical protein